MDHVSCSHTLQISALTQDTPADFRANISSDKLQTFQNQTAGKHSGLEEKESAGNQNNASAISVMYNSDSH